MSTQSPSLRSVRWDLVLFWLYLLLLVIAFGTVMNDADPDLWHHFALLDYLWKTGHFPTGDTFSYDASHQLVPDHEWGGALIFYPAFFLFGPSGLVLLKLVVLGATLVLIVRASLGSRSPTLLETFYYVLVLLAQLPFFFSTLRCGAFTHLFLALWIFWFQAERRGRPLPWIGYLITTVLWANIHPGFVLGLALLGIIGAWEFLTGRPWKKRALLLLLCLAATLINPFGWELWKGIFRARDIAHSSFTEWGPVPWLDPYNTFCEYKLLLLWTLVVLVHHVWRLGWRRCDQIAVILPLLFMAVSLEGARQTTLFAVVAGGFVPPLFKPEKSLREIREWKPWLLRLTVRGILVLLPLIYAARLLPTNQGLTLAYPSKTCPIGAVAFLRDHGVTGKLLVDFNPGSYALWQLRGQMKVSLDGRYLLVYSPETFDKVERFFAGGDGWRDALTEPKPDAVLTDVQAPAYARMHAEPGWTIAYQDATYAVFEPQR